MQYNVLKYVHNKITLIKLMPTSFIVNQISDRMSTSAKKKQELAEENEKIRKVKTTGIFF